MAEPDTYQVPQNNNQRVTMNYNPGYTDASVMKLRLDSDPIKIKLQRLLLGRETKLVRDDKTGRWYENIVYFSEPKMNILGFNAVMMFVESTVNPATVLGNFDEQTYGDYIADFREGLSDDFMLNCQFYELKDNDWNTIINSITLLIRAEKSRTINDGERKNLQGTTSVQETNYVAPKGKSGILGGIHKIFGG